MKAIGGQPDYAVGSVHAVTGDGTLVIASASGSHATRFDLKYGLPGLTHDQLITNIELYGRQVIPRVRELLAGSGPSWQPPAQASAI